MLPSSKKKTNRNVYMYNLKKKTYPIIFYRNNLKHLSQMHVNLQDDNVLAPMAVLKPVYGLHLAPLLSSICVFLVIYFMMYYFSIN
jgi:hypothetical protein